MPWAHGASTGVSSSSEWSRRSRVQSRVLPAALLFPGQGSQFEGMAAGARRSLVASELFEKAARILEYDLLEVIESGDRERLGATEVAQPAIFVTSMCLFSQARRSLSERDANEGAGNRHTGHPLNGFASAAGHSLGEYTALVAAGAVTFEDGLRLVAARGEAMQRACEETKGAMVALLGAEDARVEEACAERREKGGAIWVANYNAPGQVVVSGEISEAERAVAEPKSFGARRAVMLDVAGACHTPLMEPASKMLEDALAETSFVEPEATVWSNVTAKPYSSADEIPRLLSRQLVEPVRWKETVIDMRKRGTSVFVCFGPADTMAGIAKRCLASGGSQPEGNAAHLLRIEDFDTASSPGRPEPL